MKKLIVIAIVGMMVMGLGLAAHADTNGQWQIYFKCLDQSNGNGLASTIIYGCVTNAKDITYSSAKDSDDTSNGAGTGSAQVGMGCADNAFETGLNFGYCIDLRPPTTPNNAYNINVFELSACTATAYNITGWNPTGTYDLAAPEHLKVISAPAGVTLTDNINHVTYTNAQLNNSQSPVQFTFLSTANGTSAAPQLNWTFNNVSQSISWANPIKLELVPEPGSILAMLSGLVGLVGFGIRRRK